jgi:hypothetical protein
LFAEALHRRHAMEDWWVMSDGTQRSSVRIDIRWISGAGSDCDGLWNGYRKNI